MSLQARDSLDLNDAVDGSRVSDSPKEPLKKSSNVIEDNYESIDEVSDAIRDAGLETCSLIFGMYSVCCLRLLIHEHVK